MGKIVYLSPSTQEKNIGVLNYGTEEVRCNAVADVVQQILQAHNLTIKRNSPSMTLSQVVIDSNNVNPALHQAIHTNAYNQKARGCEAFCYKKNNTLGHILAKNVYNEISFITPTEDRGVKEGYNFYGTGSHMYETYATKAPTCLVEIIFHDNIEDVKWFLNNIKNSGIAIAKGILKTLNITYKEEEENINIQTIEAMLNDITNMKISIKALESKVNVNSELISKIQELSNKPDGYEDVLKLIDWIKSYEST